MVRCRPLTEQHASTNAVRLRLHGRLTRADRERDLYAYLPFDVPPGIAAIRISLDHDPPGDAEDPIRGAVLDLGLMGPGRLDFGSPAFRGWSGSERRTVLVGTRYATPGYRPGRIEAGRWHILLGLYGIPGSGCDYVADVELLEREPAIETHATTVTPTASPQTPEAAASSELRWIACDLHSHTVHSDGADEIATVAQAARQAGIEVLFITDHNTDSHHPYLAAAGDAAGLTLISGEEVTTYGGHFNALGIRAWVDFRHSTGRQVRSAIDAIHAQGALASINHPASDGSPWTHGMDLPFDLVEIWNGPWRPENAAALEWWAGLLRSGRRTTAVGGSDMHSTVPRGQPVGTPVTWVLAASTERGSILSGLRAGRTIVTQDSSVRLPELRVIDAAGRIAGIGAAIAVGGPIDVEWHSDAQPGRQLRILSCDGPIGTADLRSDQARGTIPLEAAGATEARYVRLEIRDDEELIAVTNPIFLEAS
jgi:PHP domain